MKISDVSEKILAKVGKNITKIPESSVCFYDKAAEAADTLADKLNQDWGLIQHRYFVKCNSISFMLGGCAVGACVGLYFGGKKLVEKVKELRASGEDETQN